MPQISVPNNIGTVSYDEMAETSPQYQFAAGASRVERTYRIRWEDRNRFVPAILGFPYIVNNTSFSENDFERAYISRWLPDIIKEITDPSAGGEQWLYASSITRMQGMGAIGTYDSLGVAQYKFASVTVAYEPRTYKIISDEDMALFATNDVWNNNDGSFNVLFAQPFEADLRRYVTKMQKPSAEFIALPRGSMWWFEPVNFNADGTRIVTPLPGLRSAAKGARVDFATARLVPSTEITYVWHEVPFLPDALNQGYVGSVNYTDFVDDDRDITYPAGTLLLLSSEIKPYRTAAGAFVNDITYRMKYFEPIPKRGHNFFLRYYNSTSDLFYTKLTSTGNNDGLGVISDGLTNSPYQNPSAAMLPKTTGVTPNAPGKGLYPYKEFRYLFCFHNPNPTY